MNNEIKEILEYLKDDSKSFIICGVSYYKISDYKAKVLLDYITNLQQKVKHYEETQTFGDYVKEVNLLIDYKSRIEKAVEYIKVRNFDEVSIAPFDDDFNCKENLLNILNGKE